MKRIPLYILQTHRILDLMLRERGLPCPELTGVYNKIYEDRKLFGLFNMTRSYAFQLVYKGRFETFYTHPPRKQSAFRSADLVKSGVAHWIRQCADWFSCYEVIKNSCHRGMA